MAKGEGKRLYRRICALIFIAVATAMFMFVWVRFARSHNNTGYMMGKGNLGMALILYAITFAFAGHGLRAFSVGVERKAMIMASVVLTALTTDAVEILISMAITGQFRYFDELLWRYILLFLAHSTVLGLIAIPMVDLYRKIFPPLQILEVYGDAKHGLHRRINGIRYK